MRILLVGAGGVGSAIARIAARRSFAELLVADYDAARADPRGRRGVHAPSRSTPGISTAVAELLTSQRCDVLLNATDPRFVMPLFRAALQAGTHYLDMAMSLSQPHPVEPYRQTGVKLGDEQFELAGEWEQRGKLALAGMGVEPGLSDVFARYAADKLFSEIDEIGVRDGANLVVEGYHFAPTFSIWTTIEECLNPPVIWESGTRLAHHPAVQRARGLLLPGRDRPVECVNVEHEEVLLMPALGRCRAGDVQVRARRRVHRRAAGPAQARAWTAPSRCRWAASRYPPAMWWPPPCPIRPPWATGCTASPAPAPGSRAPAPKARPREVYLYHVVDNAWSMSEYGSQAVVWQTAVNPVVALELIDAGTWSGAGVLGPEALPARTLP